MNNAERRLIDEMLRKQPRGRDTHDLSRLTNDLRNIYDEWRAECEAHERKYSKSPEALYEAYLNGHEPPKLPRDISIALGEEQHDLSNNLTGEELQEAYYSMINDG